MPALSPSKHRVGSAAAFHKSAKLIFRQRRAKRRHRIGKSRPVQGDHIDIAFNRNDGAQLMGGRPRLVVIIKHRALVE